MVLTGHIFSQAMQAISQIVFTAIVSKAEIKPGFCGQTATQAPQWMQAFHPIRKATGFFFDMMNYIFLYSE